jgi:hypothetical protein
MRRLLVAVIFAAIAISPAATQTASSGSSGPLNRLQRAAQ